MDGRNWNWNCNWNWNNVVDVSPFLLFESTGDSEANSDLNMASFGTGDNMEVTCEVDDAQSCCSNLSDSVCDCKHHDHDHDHDQDQKYAQCSKKKDQDYPKCPKKKCKKKDQEYAQCSTKKEHQHANYDGYNPNYRYYNDDDDEDDDGAIDQDRNCGKMGFVVSKQKQKQKQKQNKNKSKVSTVEPVKEEEKDKLFWDTCLGS